jgi:transporter family protein
VSLSAFLFMSGRILLLGFEKISFKKLGENRDPLATLFVLDILAVLSSSRAVRRRGTYRVPVRAGYSFVLIAAGSALVSFAGILLYIRALSEGEVSLVSPVYNFNVFFLLAMSVFFLGESFSLLKIAGMALMVWGTTFLNRGAGFGASLLALWRSKPCMYMIAASFFIAVGRIVDTRMVGMLGAQSATVGYALVQCVWSSLFALTLLHTGSRRFSAQRSSGNARSLRSPRARATSSPTCACSSPPGLEISLAEPLSMFGVLISVVLARFFYGEPIRDRLLGAAIMSRARG